MIAPDRQQHWQDVYAQCGEQQTSWFRPHLDLSLDWIDGLGLDKDAPIIDVGGGRSTLVDDLLARGFTDLSVLDLSGEALEQSAARLGARAQSIHWLNCDLLEAALAEAHYCLWHDRAVFHFLTDEAAQSTYVALASRSLRPGGYLLLATFAEDGPEKCSGLPVCRYNAQTLAARFGDGFETVGRRGEQHRTPFDREQSFTYLLLRRLPAQSTE